MEVDDSGHWIFPNLWDGDEAARPRIVKTKPACKSETFYKKWNREHNAKCMICGITEWEARWARWPGLETHHIVKPGRAHEATNLIRVCQRCHLLAEGHSITGQLNGVRFCWPRLPMESVIWSKLLADGACVDLMRLSELLGRYVPKPEPYSHLVTMEAFDRQVIASTRKTADNLAWNFVDRPFDGRRRLCFMGPEPFDKYILNAG